MDPLGTPDPYRSSISPIGTDNQQESTEIQKEPKRLTRAVAKVIQKPIGLLARQYIYAGASKFTLIQDLAIAKIEKKGKADINEKKALLKKKVRQKLQKNLYGVDGESKQIEKVKAGVSFSTLKGKNASIEIAYLKNESNEETDRPLAIVSLGNAQIFQSRGAKERAIMWLEKGYDVLLWNPPGYGGSKGKLTKESSDEAMLLIDNWAEKKDCPMNKRAYHGFSLGGGRTASALVHLAENGKITPDNKPKLVVYEKTFSDLKNVPETMLKKLDPSGIISKLYKGPFKLAVQNEIENRANFNTLEALQKLKEKNIETQSLVYSSGMDAMMPKGAGEKLSENREKFVRHIHDTAGWTHLQFKRYELEKEIDKLEEEDKKKDSIEES